MRFVAKMICERELNLRLSTGWASWCHVLQIFPIRDGNVKCMEIIESNVLIRRIDPIRGHRQDCGRQAMGFPTFRDLL